MTRDELIARLSPRGQAALNQLLARAAAKQKPLDDQEVKDFEEGVLALLAAELLREGN